MVCKSCKASNVPDNSWIPNGQSGLHGFHGERKQCSLLAICDPWNPKSTKHSGISRNDWESWQLRALKRRKTKPLLSKQFTGFQLDKTIALREGETYAVRHIRLLRLR
jgi:hypothetical protein